ncbi:MAG: OmpP1/FadL family transporter [Campylobacteraceae bacterium]|jgi:long-chain fatty acid transport protein|nr:OmpP1/FadL family transporter [Campylobacteraceae bacterium]
MKSSNNFQKQACVKVLAVSALLSSSVLASGYKIPEQSLSGLALGAANIAAVDGADASYYNPANMAFLDADKSELQLFATYVHLPKMTYADNANTSRNGKSKDENIVAPLFHFTTPAYHDNWRFGFSVAVPGGLAKRWDTPYQAASAKKFSLRIIEANPTAAYKINDWASFGFGARAVYSTGEVASHNPGVTKMDMEGDSFDFGYNLALAVRPTEELKLAATYRSKVDLTIEGDANLNAYPYVYSYNGGASVEIPLPAVLDLALAYTFFQTTTVEFVYERVYWSAFKQIDFEFPNESGNPILGSFGAARIKNWEDSNTFRLGITHLATDNLKLMAGFTIDKTPAPDEKLAFELPDSNSKNYSAGFEYKLNDDMSIGAAYLFSDKEERSIANNEYGVNGKFSDGGAHLVNMSFKYRF